MAETIKVRALPQAHCKDCSLAPLCLPLSLNHSDMDALDEIVKRGRPLKKGEFLFRQGDAFGSVFAVRSGALKTFSITDGGEEQITGFHLPSELVGLSGMDTESYPGIGPGPGNHLGVRNPLRTPGRTLRAAAATAPPAAAGDEPGNPR